MQLTALKVVFGVVFLVIVAGAIGSFVVGLYEVGIIATVLATMFGIFVIRDIRRAFKE